MTISEASIPNDPHGTLLVQRSLATGFSIPGARAVSLRVYWHKGGARLSGVHNCHLFLDRASAPEVMFCYLSG